MSRHSAALNGVESQLSAALPPPESIGTVPGSPIRTDYVAPDTPQLVRRNRDEEESAILRIQSHKDSLLSAPDEERCLICMNGFSPKQPAITIPCSKHCNETPVHDKCIYEWKERQHGSGSCPLCRSPLEEMVYVPPDILRSNTLTCFAARKNFVLRPVPPEFKQIRCYLRVTRVGIMGASMAYELYLQAPSILQYPLGPLPKADGKALGDQLLLVAKKRFVGFSKGQIDITLDPTGRDFERDGMAYVGSVLSNFMGLEHTVVVPPSATWSNSLKQKNQVALPATGMAEIACVMYNQNRFGRGVGPRKMRVAFSGVASEPNPTRSYAREPDWTFGEADEEDADEIGKRNRFQTLLRVPVDKNDTLLALLKKHTESPDSQTHPFLVSNSLGGVYMGRNKEPYWLEQLMAYSLDFQGRVTLPSNKNFILQVPPLIQTPEPSGSVPAGLSSSNSGGESSTTRPGAGTPAGAAGTGTTSTSRASIGDDITITFGEPAVTPVVALQFGKVYEYVNETYTMDVGYPLSILQAMGIVLSSCDRKLACA